MTKTKALERYTPPGFVMPDHSIFGGQGGENELYGPLNGYTLLEAAEISLCKLIDAQGVEATPASLRTALLLLNQAEQIAVHVSEIAPFIESLEFEVVKRLDATNVLLRELIDAQKALTAVIETRAM